MRTRPRVRPNVRGGLAIVVTALSLVSSPVAARDAIHRVSVASDGSEAQWGASRASISADGRFVALESGSPDLVAGDTNGVSDVFVHDRLTGITTRVSVASDGTQGNDNSYGHSLGISGDGRFIAFASIASNLVPDDTNNEVDVFVHDRATGQTTRVSITSAGEETFGGANHPAISRDGRYVAFESAGEFVTGDSKNSQDIYVHDRQTGVTEWITAGWEASQNADGDEPVISADGRYVAFRSTANMPPVDTDNATDILVYDRETGTTQVATPDSVSNEETNFTDPFDISGDGRFVTFPAGGSHYEIFVSDLRTGVLERVSVSSQGEPADDQAIAPAISEDGRYVVFVSSATNLVPGGPSPAYGLYVRDRQSGTTTQVDAAYSREPDISADGRYIAFVTEAATLVFDDTNGAADAFVYDQGIQDTTPPLVEYVGNVGHYTVGDDLDITCAASDLESGIASTTCQDITGPAYSFEIGVNEYSAEAVDVAGNVGMAQTSFTVEVTPTGLGEVVSELVADGNLSRNLVSKLERADFTAFINQVEAQRGKRISDVDADLLLELVQSLVNS
jgi:Tol biopolymer transport system component